MAEISLLPINSKADIKILLDRTHFQLPPEVVDAIEKNWDDLKSNNANIFRGKTMHVVGYEVSDSSVKCSVVMSDYAHYLATMSQVIPHEYYCRALFVSIILLTSDDYLVFGRMAKQTSAPDQIQCAGGGVSEKHFNPEGEIDIFATVTEELREEIYMDANNSSQITDLKPVFLKDAKPYGNIGLMYQAKTPFTKEELLEHFIRLSAEEKRQGNLPEFSELVMIRKATSDVEAFLNENKCPLVDYMPELLRQMVGV